MTDFEDYETGPFCRHFSTPCDCEEKCKICGHECRHHAFESPGECLEDGCTCDGWKEAEET